MNAQNMPLKRTKTLYVQRGRGKPYEIWDIDENARLMAIFERQNEGHWKPVYMAAGLVYLDMISCLRDLVYHKHWNVLKIIEGGKK